MIKLAIIEDIENIRKGLTSFLSMQSEFIIIASCGSIEEYSQLHPHTDVPDVILTDIGLPGMSGIEGIKFFKKIYPKAEIIMLTVFQDEENIFKALCAGATGYLLKSTPILQIKESIIDITKGEVPMTKAVARKVLNYFNPKRSYNSENELTSKEKQVMQLLVEGLSYKLIADRMSVSIETTRSHIKSIYKKLHVNSKSEVIKLALQNKKE